MIVQNASEWYKTCITFELEALSIRGVPTEIQIYISCLNAVGGIICGLL
jgi:hypothetical protein